MIARVKFSKYGFAKFLGHLDIVRYFQKAIRRSGLNVRYSEGFNPHQLLYFAAPLGLGQTSDGEYMDAEFWEDYSADELMERLSAQMSEGFAIHEIVVLPDWEKNKKKESIMSLTSCADFCVAVKDMEVEANGIKAPYSKWICGELSTPVMTLNYLDPIEECKVRIKKFRYNMSKFLDRNEIVVEKTTKKNTKDVDIKPLIFAYGYEPEAIESPENAAVGISHIEEYENGIRVFFKVSSGSVDNLKPELIMESYCKEMDIPYEEAALQYHRMETYCDLSVRGFNEQEMRGAIDSGLRKKEFVPLGKLK